MSISSDDRIAGPFSSGTVLPFDFKVFQASDVRVVKTLADGTVLPDLVAPTDYGVTLNPDQDVDAGGEVTLVTAISGGASVVVTSDIPNTQPTTITNSGGFLPATLNTAFDRQCIQLQQVNTKVQASLQFPVSDANVNSAELPTATIRANKYLAFDANGDVTVNDGPVGGTPPSAYGETLIQAVDDVAARTLLGALSDANDSVTTAKILNSNVTNAKLANMNANTVKGNATGLAAAPSDIALTASTVLGRDATGNLVALSTSQLPGTATNDNAAAGKIGEVISSNIVSGSAVSLTTNVPANVTSISLTAGDWDIYGQITFINAGTTSVTLQRGGISQTSATLPTDSSIDSPYFSRISPAFVPGTTPQYFPLGGGRISLPSTTTLYLVASSTFTVSTCTAAGYIMARRAR